MGVLDGKSAVVTGGSRGIGRAIVERLARDGASVVFNYATGKEAAEAVERAVEAAGGLAVGVQADLGEADAAERLMGVAMERFAEFRGGRSGPGGLDILVNNAALNFTPALISDTDVETFEQVWAVNAKAAFLTVRYAARHMRDEGRIVNISTLNTVRPAPGTAPYVVSKGALEQLTSVAAMELGARRITVNTVSPGATDTELLRGTNSEEALGRAAAMTPLGRLGEPGDVADVVAFLAGPDGRWVSGQNIRATGGLA